MFKSANTQGLLFRMISPKTVSRGAYVAESPVSARSPVKDNIIGSPRKVVTEGVKEKFAPGDVTSKPSHDVRSELLRDEVKLKKILRTGSADDVCLLARKLEVKASLPVGTSTKGILKTRERVLLELSRDEDTEGLSPGIQAAGHEFMIRKSMSMNLMGSERDPVIERTRSINFAENVEILPTFQKKEYDRKPNQDLTFRKLTPSLKAQIRNELNTYKRTEMVVAPESTANTCFH